MGRRASILAAAHHQNTVSLTQSIRNAIHQGAALFNDGKVQACYEIYLATAYAGLSQQTVHEHYTTQNANAVETMGHAHDDYTKVESQYIRNVLTQATQEASTKATSIDNGNDFQEAAWILRRAFDKLLKLTKQKSAATPADETVADVQARVESKTSAAAADTSVQDDVVGGSTGDERTKAESLATLVNTMEQVLDIGVHKFRLKSYPDTFVGKEAVTKLVEIGLCASREEVVEKCNALLRYGLIHHVAKDHDFKDDNLFYKLTSVAELRLALDQYGNKVNNLQGDDLIQYATILGRYKHFHKHPSLGVLRLDYDYPPAPGDIDHPDSYDYPVYYRVVPGLTFEMCQLGELTPAVAKAFDDAVLWLANHKDVSVITGDCGFRFWFVERVRKIASKKIISLSPLMQLPIMVAACAPQDKILVLTANGKSLDPMQDLIKRQVGVDGQDTQFIFVGCENVPHFGKEVAEGLKVDVAKAEPGIVALAQEMLRAHPDTRMILFECTELPPYSDAVREATRLPVFDAITNCSFFMNGFLDSKNFGLSGWYEEWDGIQEEYVLGQNLDEGQKLQCVWCKNNEWNYAK